MPILGVIDSGKSGHLAPAANYYSIATQTLSSGASSITFSSIPQIYSHLQLRGLMQGTYGGDNNGAASMQFNGNASAIYTRRQTTYTNGAGGIGGYAATAYTYASLGECNLIGSQTNIFGANIWDIYDYTNTSKTKTIKCTGGTEKNGSYSEIGIFSSFWNSTSAINSITIYQPNGNLATGTTIALYGVL